MINNKDIPFISENVGIVQIVANNCLVLSNFKYQTELNG